MAKVSLETLKAWYVRGIKPLQEQFWHWMDSYWHKDELIPISSIDTLQAQLDGKANASTDIIVDASTIESFNPVKADGYLAGNVFVSYINPSSTDPDLDFKKLFIYQCVADAATGESPETHPLKWERIGETMTFTSSTTANGWVGTLTEMYLLTGMRNNDTVAVVQPPAVYKYSTETGQWGYFCELKPVVVQVPGASTTAVMSQKAVTDLADTKVDKVAGKSLVSDSEIARLAGINDHFRGTYLTKAALELAIPVGNGGDEATVDAGVGSDPIKYIWDTSDNAWKQGGGGSVTVDQSVINGSTNAVSGGAVSNAFTALKDGVVSAGDTLKKLYDLILGKASKPINPTLGRVHYSDANGNIVETSFSYLQILQTGSMDTSDPNWLAEQQRLITSIKNADGTVRMGTSTELMDKSLPPATLTTLSSDSGWVNERRTITGDNSTYAIGRKGQSGWLDDSTFVECESATHTTTGSVVFRRNRAIDALDSSDTQDSAVMDRLDPSRTGGSTDDGWNLVTNTKVISDVPCRVGTFWNGGINGEGYYYNIFKVSGSSYYAKRIGVPQAVQRKITSASHPTLVGRLLAWDFATSAYTKQAGDEVFYESQYYYDSATRADFEAKSSTIIEKKNFI